MALLWGKIVQGNSKSEVVYLVTLATKSGLLGLPLAWSSDEVIIRIFEVQRLDK